MSTQHIITGSPSEQMPTIHHHHPTFPKSKTAQSVPDYNRGASLPHHFLPPSLWSANISSASLVESEAAARGEHILDEATVAHKISALRQLNGVTISRHRYAKSAGARSSTYSQPVIVRTYTGSRPQSQQRDLVNVKNDWKQSAMASGKMDLQMPPVEAFSFKSIMDEIRHGVTEDLEKIAEICARSKYSLSNQYEVHMPPHGRGDAIIQVAGPAARPPTNLVVPTLQAVSSDDEHSRQGVRGFRRRTKSAAYGTLETIMSSSRSSEEDNARKKPAAVIAEEVRGRAAKKNAGELSSTTPLPNGRPTKYVHSKSASFAAFLIDNAQNVKDDASSQPFSPTLLVGEPARPQTSAATMLDTTPGFAASADLHSMGNKSTIIRNESKISEPPSPVEESSVFRALASWLPWRSMSATQNFRSPVGRQRSASIAEGSLRDLLKFTDGDMKGKGVDRSG